MPVSEMDAFHLFGLMIAANAVTIWAWWAVTRFWHEVDLKRQRIMIVGALIAMVGIPIYFALESLRVQSPGSDAPVTAIERWERGPDGTIRRVE